MTGSPAASWRRAPAALALAEGEVHVCRVDVPAQRPRLGRLLQVLDHGERTRAAMFRVEAARERFIAGRAGLRLVLGGALGKDPSSLRFARRCGHCGGRDHGKPYLPSGDGLHFNVSHSGELALVALSRGRHVGVDVEATSRAADTAMLAARHFSTDERAEMAGLDHHGRRLAFFRCWAAKEAYLKARGVGVAEELDSFSVGTGGDRPGSVWTGGERTGWTVHPLDPGAGHVGAVVARGDGWELRLWTL